MKKKFYSLIVLSHDEVNKYNPFGWKSTNSISLECPTNILNGPGELIAHKRAVLSLPPDAK